MTDFGMDKEIWEFLMRHIQNPYGVAGLMGNLFAESSLNCMNITPSGGKKITAAEYMQYVESGDCSAEEFANDGVAVGLAQWRYHSRKRALYNLCYPSLVLIFDWFIQCCFMVCELKTYKTVWNILTTSHDIQECSDIVLLKYEKPANVSDKVKAKRAKYAQNYFDIYAEKDGGENHE